MSSPVLIDLTLDEDAFGFNNQDANTDIHAIPVYLKQARRESNVSIASKHEGFLRATLPAQNAKITTLPTHTTNITSPIKCQPPLVMNLEQSQRMELNRAAAIRRRLAAGKYPCKAGAAVTVGATTHTTDTAASEYSERETRPGSAGFGYSVETGVKEQSESGMTRYEQDSAQPLAAASVQNGSRLQAGTKEGDNDDGWRTTKKRRLPDSITKTLHPSLAAPLTVPPDLEGLPAPYTPTYSPLQKSNETGPSGEGSAAPPLHSMKLSQQQIAVLQAVAQQKSVFVTGCAGTGKSFLLEAAIRQMR